VITENVKAREAAEEAVSMMSQLGAESGLSTDGVVRYWELVAQSIAS